MHGKQRALHTVWRFLGYKSTRNMPHKHHVAWLKFTAKVLNLEIGGNY